ncbi:1-aminocyclopropane-1-carboxylate deaminase/D-cysteine desulfhydrase [Undibacterium sp. SXout20W]|uniref:1-aminocyclopropane-1-carboxylate deaminase/D-cysteine desulfhydrase n=1 Tax=Undibacterium sp. SXout20W TaxID=3413051 RepID=UPI003BF296D6
MAITCQSGGTRTIVLYHLHLHNRIVFYVPASPCQRIDSDLFPGIVLWMKRDDLLHPQVSGNKFRKLKYPLLALKDRQPHLVSMGGLWSNHIHALAHAAAIAGYPSTAFIRAADGMNSDMLDDCRRLGMEIHYVSREIYRRLRENDQHWRSLLLDANEDYVWLPEGGSTPAALHGVAELVIEVGATLGSDPDVFMVACGTGATMAGIIAGAQGKSKVIGVAAIKNAEYLHADISRLLKNAAYPDDQNYLLLTDFHQGGYAKITIELMTFCDMFQQQTGIILEPVYTGKMLYTLHQLCKQNYFPPQTCVVAVHTGGLQGNRGFSDTPLFARISVASTAKR